MGDTAKASPARAHPKRETKAIEQFVTEHKETKEFIIPKGTGTKLGDIENVVFLIGKAVATSEELKQLHRLCYGRPGSKNEIKKNLREFSGYAAAEKESEVAKKKAMASKLDTKTLKSILAVCDLMQSGSKADQVERLVSFVAEPSASGKRSLAEKVGEKRKRAAKKKEVKEKKAAKKAGKAKGKAKDDPLAGLKRPMSAFFLYSQNKRDKVIAENPDAKLGEIQKILGEKWKGISEERRAKYNAQAAELKEEYEKKKAALLAKAGKGAGASKAKPAKKAKVEAKEEEAEEKDEEEDEEEAEDEEGEDEGGDDDGEGDEEEADAEEAGAEDGDAAGADADADAKEEDADGDEKMADAADEEDE